MSQNPDTMNNMEIAGQMATRLHELRSVANRIQELEALVPVGTQLHQGIKRVHHEVQNAGHDLERLCAVTRTLIV
jgi:hypothetical protein